MTAREMRRLDSITKSPVFSLYGEAIAGVTVIRAFGAPARVGFCVAEPCLMFVNP